MAEYITVDSGTTNTRVSLVKDSVIVDVLKFKVAHSDTKTRSEMLAEQLKAGIEEILLRNKKSACDISRIICCGMITSDIGLIKLDHIPSPCGLYELSQNLYETQIKEISSIPFVFVRGVKEISGDHIDMMRGEETEIYGINEQPEANSMYVLPGSHSKLICIDEEHRISHFSTALTGEMISAIACGTILKNVINLNQSADDNEYLQKGYIFSKEHGISEALFKVRSLKMFLNCNESQVFSFYIGAILAPEIDGIIKSAATKIFVGGKAELKDPTVTLLRLNSDKNVQTISAEIAENATAYGCIRIYEKSFGN